MDFNYWKKERDIKSRMHRCQQNFIEQRFEHFEDIKDFKTQYQTSFSNEAFIYQKQLIFK